MPRFSFNELGVDGHGGIEAGNKGADHVQTKHQLNDGPNKGFEAISKADTNLSVDVLISNTVGNGAILIGPTKEARIGSKGSGDNGSGVLIDIPKLATDNVGKLNSSSIAIDAQIGDAIVGMVLKILGPTPSEVGKIHIPSGTVDDSSSAITGGKNAVIGSRGNMGVTLGLPILIISGHHMSDTHYYNQLGLGSHDANAKTGDGVAQNSSILGALTHIGAIDSTNVGAIALDPYGVNGEGHHEGHKSNEGLENGSAYSLKTIIGSIDIDGLESSSAKTGGALVGIASSDG